MLFALACAPPSEAPPATPEQKGSVRNLVLVCFDTVRFDSFRSATIVDPKSPSAAWIQRAVRLGNVLAPAPWTVPSVASVLTGRDPIRHGAGVFASAVANLDKEIPSAISAEVPTLAEKLGGEGFETAAFVAHPWFESKYGLKRGFESFTLEKSRRRLIGKATSWISWRTANPEDRPFFLYLHLMDSHRHLSWTHDERRRRERHLYERAIAHAVTNAPAGICRNQSADSCSQYLAYVRSIAEQFEALSNVLVRLEETGDLAHTAVILYSDHGEEFNDHGAIGRARGLDPRNIYGIGHGQSLYQELLHVPLFIWHPDLSGRNAHGPVSLLDLMPTALDWLGLEAPEDLDGRNLAPWLRGEAPPPEDQRLLHATGIAYGPAEASIVRLPWKLIQSASGEARLFNLVNDARESKPANQPAVAEQLGVMLAEWLERKAPAASDPPSLSPEQIEKLQSLGYLEGVPSEDAPD